MKRILAALTMLFLAVPASAWGWNHIWGPVNDYGTPLPLPFERDTYRDRQERRLEEIGDELRRMRQLQEDRDNRERMRDSLDDLERGAGR